ncbi:MAG: substrate-binding domain-containing protein [Lachnospiraceae bacterium]|nr:substrate-binding domain-containing protein [Lachnospiraceae bacterium]MDD3615653.1 substrate-binding domain-containing protein [Lachnospiraceae bacterium]
MIRNKRYYTVILLLFFAFLLTLYGWFNKSSQTEKKYEMVYIPKIIDEDNDFWTSLIEGAEMASTEYGVNLKIVAGESEEDVEGQNQLISQTIEEKPDALLISPCSYTESNELLKEAKEAGIQVILVDSRVSESLEDAIVATDNYAAGETLGEYASGLIDGDDQIAVVGHVEGSSTAIERLQGVQKGLGEKQNNIVSTVYCNSEFGKAYALGLELMNQYPDLKLMIGLNEYSAVGVARAIRDKGKIGEIKMAGFDSSVEEIQLMESGVFQGIVIQKPFNMGYLGVKQAVSSLKGEHIEHVLNSGSELITMDNIYTEENQKLLFPFVGKSQ